MGTDINITPQIEIAEHWFSVYPIEQYRVRARCYTTFEILAGVRSYGWYTPISKPRGLPGDFSPHELINGWRPDELHDVSWLTLAEIFAYDWPVEAGYFVDWVRELRGVFDQTYGLLIDYNVHGMRLVFGFDS